MQISMIPVSDLRPSPLILRRVDRSSLEYFQLRESIAAVGLLQPLLVRNENEVVDGLHRLAILKEQKTILAPCLVRDLSDEEVLRVQIAANEVRCPTAMIDLAKRLWRIVHDDGVNVNQLAHQLSRSPHWVRSVLNLNRLCPEAKAAMENNQLSLKKAIDLAKLPITIQLTALTESDDDVKGRVRRFRSGETLKRVENKYDGIKPAFRQYREVCDEVDSLQNAGTALITASAVTTLDGWREAIRWVLQIDPTSLRKRKRK